MSIYSYAHVNIVPICSRVHLYMCRFVHMSIYSYAHVYMILICSRVHCTHMFTCSPVHMSVCTHAHILICSRVHYTHMFTCSPVHMSVCIYVHIFICSHVRTDPSTLEHILYPHVHWRTYVTLSYSCIHVSQSRNYVSCVIYVPQSPSQQSRQRMPALANQCVCSRCV